MSLETLHGQYVRLPTIMEELEVDDLWSSDVEKKLLEAAKIYPPCGRQKIRHTDGNCYGRHAIISLYIKKKCGKYRSPRQISSHLQYLERRSLKKKLLKVPRINLSTDTGPNGLVEYKHSCDQILLFSQKYADVSSLEILQDLPFYVSYRQISTRKLSVLGVYAYREDYQQTTDKIIFGFICSNKPKILNTSISIIAHKFDKTLLNCYYLMAPGNFYVVKTWVNLGFNEANVPPSDYIWRQIFYSPYKMETSMEISHHINGKLIWTENCNQLAIDEVDVGFMKYYIYHVESQFSKWSIKLVENLKYLKKYETNTIRKIFSNYTLMLTLKDVNTQEILLVMPIVFDYDPDFTGYQVYKINF